MKVLAEVELYGDIEIFTLDDAQEMFSTVIANGAESCSLDSHVKVLSIVEGE